MRRWLGLVLMMATFAIWGCEQESSNLRVDGGIAIGSGNPDDYENPGPGKGLPGDDQIDPTGVPDNLFNDFGGECSPPDGCDRDSAGWPDCLNATCSTGDCTYPGLAGDYGYCTRGCTTDEECDNAVANGPYGTEFTCMTDGTSGTCVPGAGERCDRLRNGRCDDPNDACKWGLIFAADDTYGGTCQPATQGGREVGESCDEEQGIYCANDLCLFDTCTSLCHPGAAQSPCPEGWTCFDDFDIGVTFDVCLPAYCETNDDCTDGFTCVLTFEFNSDTVLRGICLATDEGSAQPGEGCGEERTCQGATCFDTDDGEGFCSGMCDTDADCGPGAYCDIVNFGIDADPGSAPAQICRPGERTGSGRPCAVDAQCAADDDNPEEACDYYIAGELDGGRYVSPPRLAGRCAEISPNAVGLGETCSELQPCRTEGLCLNGGGGSFCSAACRDSRDCDGGLCFAIDFGGQSGGVCIPAGLFGQDGASLSPCGNDGDCGDGESCQLNPVEASQNPVAELLCLNAGGRGAPGSDCNAAEQCASLDCQPRTTDPAAPGYCRAPCRADADCGAGFACERVRPVAGGNLVNMCRPVAACQPCAFDGSAPCGGDYTCGLVNYGAGVASGACLAQCDGPGDITCNDGFGCREVVGGDGRATGDFACTPLLADEVCADARPQP